MLDPLVDRQDRDVAGTGQPPVAQNLLHAAHHLGTAVRSRDDPVHKVGAREVEAVFRKARGAIGQQVFGFGSEEVVDAVGCGHGPLGLLEGDGCDGKWRRSPRVRCPIV